MEPGSINSKFALFRRGGQPVRLLVTQREDEEEPLRADVVEVMGNTVTPVADEKMDKSERKTHPTTDNAQTAAQRYATDNAEVGGVAGGTSPIYVQPDNDLTEQTSPADVSANAGDNGTVLDVLPAPIMTDAVNDGWVDFEVGGKHFSTRLSNLTRHPNTRLANALESGDQFDPVKKAFRFDRNPDIFTYVLDYYRSGELHFPHQLCGPTVKKELRFWGIDENEIEPCCWSRYKEHDDQMESLHELGQAFAETDFTFRRSDMLLLSAVQKWRERVWKFLEDPTSSKLAHVSDVFNLMFVCFWIWLVVFSVPSTARSFRDGTPIYCPLRRTWSSVFTPFPPGIEPQPVAWHSVTQPLSHASPTDCLGLTSLLNTCNMDTWICVRVYTSLAYCVVFICFVFLFRFNVAFKHLRSYRDGVCL